MPDLLQLVCPVLIVEFTAWLLGWSSFVFPRKKIWIPNVILQSKTVTKEKFVCSHRKKQGMKMFEISFIGFCKNVFSKS